MGGSLYNTYSRTLRADNSGYHTKSQNEIFKQSRIHESLSPVDLKFRESRDSEAHPNSLPCITGLDVTGSMGKVPHDLIKSGLPTMMSTLIENHLPDVAVCFVAVGDHKSDSAPLQVAQFESGDEELDRHLENTWLEGNGGGNGGESYFLPWYFAAKKTRTDAWEKRKEKGFIFTIGDEHCHGEIDSNSIKRIFGDSEATEGAKAIDLLREAQEKYHVFHLNLGGDSVQSSWKRLIGENNIKVDHHEDIPKIIASTILSHYSTPTTQRKPSIENNLATDIDMANEGSNSNKSISEPKITL